MTAHSMGPRSHKRKRSNSQPPVVRTVPVRPRLNRSYITNQGPHQSGNLSVFPENYKFKARWAVNSTLSSAAGIDVFGTDKVFNLNSIYEPESGNTNHAVLGWTELANIYRRYRVTGVKYELVVYDPNVETMAVGIWVQPPENTFNMAGQTVQTMAEKGNMNIRFIANTGQQVIRHTKFHRLNNICNVRKTVLFNNETYSALMTANPAKVPTLKLASANTTSGTVQSLRYKLIVTYYGIAFERKALAISDPTP